MIKRRNKTAAERHEEIYVFIRDFTKKNGYPPTVREIGRNVGLKSASTVHAYLTQMEEKGLLCKDPTLPRCLSLPKINPWKDTVQVPLIGTVTAGIPITAVENSEGSFSFSQNLLRTKKETFMLRVRGTSMINIGIRNDDYVIVQKQNTADEGQVVVALVDGGEATVKRFFHDKEKGCIRLQPENDTMQPIYAEDVQILGTVIGVFRTAI